MPNLMTYNLSPKAGSFKTAADVVAAFKRGDGFLQNPQGKPVTVNDFAPGDKVWLKYRGERAMTKVIVTRDMLKGEEHVG